MLGALEPSAHRALRDVAGIGVIVLVDVLADGAIVEADAADAVGGRDTVGAVVREIMAHRHVVAVATRNHGEARREFQRRQSSAHAFLIYQAEDFSFLLGQAGDLFGRGRSRVHQVEARDDRGDEREHEQPNSRLDRTAPADHCGSRHPDDFRRTVTGSGRAAARCWSSAHLRLTSKNGTRRVAGWPRWYS